MFNKNLLLTLLVVVLFAVSGAVVYFGIFNKTSTFTGGAIDVTEKPPVNLMPYGEDLNFDKVTNRVNVNPPIQYKQVAPQDVGVDTNTMIRNAAGNGAVPNSGL